MRPRPPFAAVCFDCDGTLSRIEGIDELARLRGVEQEIAPLTAMAMDGSVPIDAVYGRRLDIVRPDRTAIGWLGRRYVEEIVPGAKATVARLQSLGKAVYIVSGGLRPAIAPLAGLLRVPFENVHAVEIFFDTNGGYLGFDSASPLCRPEGKAVICAHLGAVHGALAMVGDGVTDLAARGAGAFFAGFGGVFHRDAVLKSADAFVTAPDLTATLDVLLSEDERSGGGGNPC